MSETPQNPPYQSDPQHQNFPQQQNFPQYPSYSAPPVDDQPLARPSTLNTAAKAWIVGTIIGVVGNIIAAIAIFGDIDNLAQKAKDKDTSSTLDASDYKSILEGVAVASAIFALVVGALVLFFVFKARVGRNWARIVLTVIGALIILGNLASLATQGDGISLAVKLVGAIIAVVAVVFLWLPATNAYFSSVRARALSQFQ